MGLRETVNQNPAITTGATLGIILLAVITIVWQLNSGAGTDSRPERSSPPTTNSADSMTPPASDLAAKHGS